MTEANLDIHVVDCLGSNYVCIIRDPDTGTVAVIDPGDAQPVADKLAELGWSLDYILLTHHHDDHIAGVDALRTDGVKVVGATADKHRLPALDQEYQPGDKFQFGNHTVDVLAADGHTVGHIALHFPAVQALFCGDALFAMGCGKLFEGTAQQAWDTFCRFAELPDETRAYFGHEITEGNADFCEKIDPDHAPTAARIAAVRAKRAAGERTIPTTIGEEKETNIFMRAAEPQVAAAVGMAGADAPSVFAELRRRKDQG